MPLDPQASAFLKSREGAPELYEIPLHEARALSYAELDFAGPTEPVGSIIDRYFPSPTADLPLRIFTPEGEGPFNAMVYFHGGGWALNFIDFYDAPLATLANLTRSVIVAVNYQKAPEHKFPVPFDDCFAALEWVVAHAEELSIDPARIGVGGDSAGGNLASAVALKSRDLGSPSLAYQLLIYPCNDRDIDSESMVANATGYGLSRREMDWLWGLYLNGLDDEHNPYAVPHRSHDFSSLPPTVLVTAEFDVLRDDGRRYAEKLKEAGVPVIYRDYPGMIHGFFSYSVDIQEGFELRRHLAEDINSILGSRLS